MARSSTSLPPSPLPFGADTHNHNAYHRSVTALNGPNDQVQPGQQDYSSFVAAAQAEDVRSHRASASIPPSSVKELPLGHRNLLRRHKVLLWVVSAVFEISLVALTAGIILCAVRAHEYNADGGGKAAFVIVGVFGFAGMVGSAAVGWFVWRGRKERARLERRWTADEQMKERRSVRETSRANEVLKSIKGRERSLSRSRSRSRGRGTHRPLPATRQERPYSDLIPSFRAMTPAATEAPSANTEQAGESDWTNRLDLSTSEDEEGYLKSSGQITNERLEQEIFKHISRPTTPGSPRPGSPSINGVLVGSSPTLLNNSSSSPADGPVAPPQRQNERSQDFASSPQSPTLFDFSAIHGPPSPPPKSPLPALPPARSSPVPGRRREQPAPSGDYGPSPTTQNTSILNSSPLIDPAGGIHPAFRYSGPFGLPPDLRSSRQNVNDAATTSTPINPSSPPILSSPRQPPSSSSLQHQQQSPSPPPHSSPLSAQSPTLLNSSPVAGPIDSATVAIHPAYRNPPPNNPQNNHQTPNSGTATAIATATNTASTLLNSSSTPNDNPTSPPSQLPIPSNPPPPTALASTSTPPPPTNPLPTTTPTAFIRASNGNLGSAQSDENFLAMLDAASDANSEDEARLAVRRMQSQERVRAWGLSPYLTGREEDAGGRVRKVGKGLRRFSAKFGRGK